MDLYREAVSDHNADDSMWMIRAAQRALMASEPYFQASYGNELASMKRFCSVITLVPIFEILARWSAPLRDYKPPRMSKEPLTPGEEDLPKPWSTQRIYELVKKHVDIWEQDNSTITWNHDLGRFSEDGALNRELESHGLRLIHRARSHNFHVCSGFPIAGDVDAPNFIGCGADRLIIQIAGTTPGNASQFKVF
eukprot:GEMP01070377.1.p1 GENE.GEMP01070377.1~~GEMP01070377.1.p1  ORF type:complete len:194 (+),score=30.73 GEMP01070377.1:225-806(+)